MISSNAHNELEEMKSELIGLLKKLNFKEICVLDHPEFENPPQIFRQSDDPLIPTAAAVKNESIYFFELLSSEHCDHGLPDTLRLMHQSIRGRENSTLILVVPYGKKGLLAGWEEETGNSFDSIWEIITDLSS